MLRWLDQCQARAHLYRQLGQQPRQEKHAQGLLSSHGPGRVGRPVVSQIGKLHLRTHLRACCSLIEAERRHVGAQFQGLFNHVEDLRSFALILCRGILCQVESQSNARTAFLAHALARIANRWMPCRNSSWARAWHERYDSGRGVWGSTSLKDCFS